MMLDLKKKKILTDFSPKDLGIWNTKICVTDIEANLNESTMCPSHHRTPV